MFFDCKDYGTIYLDEAEVLASHTEQFLINSSSFVIHRAIYASKIFDHSDLFDVVLLRSTIVYDLSDSFYDSLLKMTARVAENDVLELIVDSRSILHETHVDDCAEVYVAIAAHENRNAMKGKCYNISEHRYETLSEIVTALVKEYKIADGVKYTLARKNVDIDVMQMLISFSQ